MHFSRSLRMSTGGQVGGEPLFRTNSRLPLTVTIKWVPYPLDEIDLEGMEILIPRCRTAL